jgi:molecular chaperone DnaK
VRSLTSELQQIYHSLGAATADVGAGAPPPGGGGRPGGRQPQGGDDDVIDADFTVS